MTSPVPRTKEPHLAGRAYPARADVLADTVRTLLAAGGGPRPGTVAIVVPHGSYERSGGIAARAFAAAAGRWRRAVVVGPSHLARMEGAAVLPMEAYRTPLGTVPIDAAGVAALVRPPLVRPNPAVFMREQAIEVQLPLLQAAAPGCAVVPLLVGALALGEAEALGELLRAVADPETLLVVSSDLVHYGRRFGYLPVPPTDAAAVAAAVRELDDGAIARMVAADADGFARYVEETGATVCGHHAIEALLRALGPGARGECLATGSSLDTTGEHETVVGYAAVVFRSASAAG